MRSLYGKFIVTTIGIMLFSFIFSFIISNTYYQYQLKPYNDQKITKIALNIAVYVEGHPANNLTEYLESISAVGYQIYLVDQQGNGTFFGEAFRNRSIPDSTTKHVLNGDLFHGILHFPKETFVTGFFANELRNTVGVPLNHNGQSFALFIRPDINLLFGEMHILFGWIIGLSIALSIVMVVISAKYLVKPISDLTRATKSLSNGIFNVKLDINRHDELEQLSNSFLRMAHKLEQIDEVRKEFISNISHDIQSPLSSIKGYTNLLENKTLSNEERSQFISIIKGEITRLSTLTKQLLLLALLDRNEDLLKEKSINLGQQLKELVRNFQWAISEKDLMLSYSLPDIEMNGDPSLLNTVWDNLLSNAIKYNYPNGSIEISIEKNEESVFVTFTDTGIGLKSTELDRMFDRFYRADIARTRSVEGTGLGLSIVETIIRMHDGTIHVSSKEKEGTTFNVVLPVGEGK
ncbi:sensor histidine kinase [Neobacillus cucumis]|uniref:Heme sensor protein HssS n=1 Tax=Neobacillus cucumis TaxID=1740721 RepID=A0A2N5HVG1_9BACI|nr:HAMP domain-containing sensor histidine kinase [Neobacillus cucumis]PLS09502.1 sensor histidine kinase [Neobacillus cucumis]